MAESKIAAAQTTAINEIEAPGNKDNSNSLIEQAISDIELSEGDALLISYDHLRITKENEVPQPEPVITMSGKPVAARSNITAISAAALLDNSTLRVDISSSFAILSNA